MVHPWHDIDIGENAPHVVNAVVEIPRGSNVKYEFEKRSSVPGTGIANASRRILAAMSLLTRG